MECEILCCAEVGYQYNSMALDRQCVHFNTYVAHLYPLHACDSKLTAVYKCYKNYRSQANSGSNTTVYAELYKGGQSDRPLAIPLPVPKCDNICMRAIKVKLSQ